MTPETLRYQSVEELLLGVKAPLSGSAINGRAYAVDGTRLRGAPPPSFFDYFKHPSLPEALFRGFPRILGTCEVCWETLENCKCGEDDDV